MCVYDICKSRIEPQQNYSDKWLVGADLVKTSNSRNHARSDQHIHAMSVYCKLADGSSTSSEPTIVSMLQEIPEDTIEQVKKEI